MKKENILIIDGEWTIHADGNPFSKPNRLMCVGTMVGDSLVYHDIEHSNEPYGENLQRLRQLFEAADVVVGFNVKQDLHYLRRYITDLPIRAVFDCQLAEFLLSDQQSVYPSLELCSERYHLPPKFVDIEELWDAGIDTSEIPRPILEKRVLSDVVITKALYEKQVPILEKQGKMPLFKLQCDDLLVLQEMEFNGMVFDQTESLRLGVQTETDIQEIYGELARLVPFEHINWNSGDHLSAVLYGGIINYPSTKITYRTLKSGEVKGREVKCFAQQSFPQLVAPLPKTETARTKDLTDKDLEGLNAELLTSRKPILCRHYFTNETVLKSLAAMGTAREIINHNLRLSELAKLRDTYYLGIPKLINEMQWAGDLIHGSFNQVVARTGRLSSSKPNLQNFAGVIKPLFKSRHVN